MRLFYSPASPFASKVRMAARHCGVELECVVAGTGAEPDDLVSANPLGKIPAVVLEAGGSVYDSRVICEYLDRMSGNLLIPQTSDAWLQAKRLEALADGMTEAAMLTLYERRYRPEEKWHQPWIDKQWRRAFRALAALDAEIAALPREPHIGHFALAADLGWLQLRYGGQWEEKNPRLADWLADFPTIFPAFEELRPKG